MNKEDKKRVSYKEGDNVGFKVKLFGKFVVSNPVEYCNIFTDVHLYQLWMCELQTWRNQNITDESFIFLPFLELKCSSGCNSHLNNSSASKALQSPKVKAGGKKKKKKNHCDLKIFYPLTVHKNPLFPFKLCGKKANMCIRCSTSPVFLLPIIHVPVKGRMVDTDLSSRSSLRFHTKRKTLIKALSFGKFTKPDKRPKEISIQMLSLLCQKHLDNRHSI